MLIGGGELRVDGWGSCVGALIGSEAKQVTIGALAQHGTNGRMSTN